MEIDLGLCNFTKLGIRISTLLELIGDCTLSEFFRLHILSDSKLTKIDS
jgi:hypothetical protein